MGSITVVFILLTTLVTAFISGIFGMAGGLILMAVLTALVSVAMAMVIHGTLQMVANGYRAFLLRDAMVWPVVRAYLVGAALGILGLSLVRWVPDRQVVYALLGLTGLLVWIPRHLLDLDIQKPGQAMLAGGLVQGLNTLAGVAGPLLDLFFVRTDMTRQQIVATKALTQTVSHLIKVGFWGLPLIQLAGWAAVPPVWLFALAIPLSLSGTWLGGQVLDRLSDHSFRRWMKGLITLISLVLLLRAAGAF